MLNCILASSNAVIGTGCCPTLVGGGALGGIFTSSYILQFSLSKPPGNNSCQNIIINKKKDLLI